LTIIILDNIIVSDMDKTDQNWKFRADLVLHPERLRIIAALTGSRLSAGELARRLPDISQAGLYRHLKRLERGGIIEIVATHQVRGTVEKIYTCPAPEKAHFTEEDVRQMSPEMRHHSFTAFMANIYSQFLAAHRSAETDQDIFRKMGYQSIPLDISPDEMSEFQHDLKEVLARYSPRDSGPRGADPETRGERFNLSLILFPEIQHDHKH